LNILVTGSSGYLGERLVRYILLSGHNPVEVSRDINDTSLNCIHFDLNNIKNLKIPKNLDAVVHLAINKSKNIESKNDLFAAKKLINLSNEVSAQFIFVSSQTASPNSISDYGLTKWHIEQEVKINNGVVVRFGQIYGGSKKGLYGELVSLVHRFPILPSFIPNPVVQPIHVDDCAIGIMKIIEQKIQIYKMYCLAESNLILFKEFLNKIAIIRLGRFRFFIPIPIAPVKILSKVIGFKLSNRLGISRLLSLFSLPIMETKADLDLLDLQLRPLSSGMTKSGFGIRRKLILEGFCLLRYLLKERPNIKIVCRYVRMIEKLRSGLILNLPNWMLFYPMTLALLDRKNIDRMPIGKELAWRINAATVIAESCTQSYGRFNNISKKNTLFSITYNLSKAILLGLFWYACSIIFVGFNQGFIKKKMYYYEH